MPQDHEVKTAFSGFNTRYLRFAASYSDGALAPNKAGRVAPPTDLQNFSRLLPFCLAYRWAKNLHYDEF